MRSRSRSTSRSRRSHMRRSRSRSTLSSRRSSPIPTYIPNSPQPMFVPSPPQPAMPGFPPPQPVIIPGPPFISPYDSPTTSSPQNTAKQWRKCVLPDRNLYYIHNTRRVVTDVDLRDGNTLDAVMAYLKSRNDGALAARDRELWLQNTGSHERGFIPLGCLIDHKKRSATFDTLPEASGDGGDDELDAECRYWSFMEAHPVHAHISHDVQAEALAVLAWNWTAPAPFNQEECRELANLIRSFENGGVGHTPLRNHIISGVLLRVGK
ncbi:hypothetical protein BD779DRAFT_304942 [Infundibulicybe gibba]|nr:hypothetical protein BD779DRAFT_304942 [Infundibulicybe gibba]